MAYRRRSCTSSLQHHDDVESNARAASTKATSTATRRTSTAWCRWLRRKTCARTAPGSTFGMLAQRDADDLPHFDAQVDANGDLVYLHGDTTSEPSSSKACCGFKHCFDAGDGLRV